MLTHHEVTLNNVVGVLKVRDSKGEERTAREREAVKADEVVIATKRSSCNVRAGAVTIAQVTNDKGGKAATRVTTFHPLARGASKSKLKSTVLKAGGRLVLQAQHQFAQGVSCYNLTVDLT